MYNWADIDSLLVESMGFPYKHIFNTDIVTNENVLRVFLKCCFFMLLFGFVIIINHFKSIFGVTVVT